MQKTKTTEQIKRPKLQSPMFTAKVLEIKALLKQGNVQAATEVLNQAWNIAGKDKASRTVAHDLGNEIQRVIFEQFEASEGVAQ
jgi:hypothetical protein